MDDARIVYDDQAGVFESRAGLPDVVAEQVAEMTRSYAGLAAHDLVVEIGAGTGEIGQWLARQPTRYLGLDGSRAMLEVFRPRLPAGAGAAVLEADADRPWPIRGDGAAAVFGSRVLHLLQPDHVLRQIRRVARPAGATLVCGRVQHSPSSPRSLARGKLRELLGRHGMHPRPTGGRPSRLFALAEAAGCVPLPEYVAATWPETVSVHQVIDWWRGKTSLGGVNPPAAVAETVLAALTAWASEAFDQPTEPVTTHTRYLLEGARFPPTTKEGPT